MLDKKNLEALAKIETQVKEAEQKRKVLEEKAQKQVGTTVKLNLKQYRTKDGDVLRDTIDGITYEIDPFYNDCAKPGDCFVQVEKIKQDIILDCKPAPTMKIFEIEDALTDIRHKADTADISRLPRTQEKINELLSTLQYYDQRKHVFGKEYEEKVPQYIAKLNELNAAITRKITRFDKFDSPVPLKFKLNGQYCDVKCDNETIAQLMVLFEKNNPVIMRIDIKTEGYDKSKLLRQIIDQSADYLKIGFKASEIYVTAEPGSLNMRVLEKAGFAMFRKIRNEIVFYKPL